MTRFQITGNNIYIWIYQSAKNLRPKYLEDRILPLLKLLISITVDGLIFVEYQFSWFFVVGPIHEFVIFCMNYVVIYYGH